MSIPTINFGKYKGKSLDEIAVKDSKYILYLLSTEFLKKEQISYIMENLIDDIVIGFGRYPNQTFKNLKAYKPSYLNWLSKNTKHIWLTTYLN